MIMGRKRRAGVSALVVALSTMVLISFVAIVIDLGYVRLVQVELQAAADASSLSGARVLNQQSSGLSAAQQTTIIVGSLNRVIGNPVILANNPTNNPMGDVVLGVWKDEVFTASLDPQMVNAVQVLARRRDLFPLFSNIAFQRDGLGAAAIAVAVQGMKVGAGTVPYYLPFGLAKCTLDRWPKDTLIDMTFVLSPTGSDTTGWAGVGDSPNASWVRDLIEHVLPCMHEWYETGEIDNACASASVGTNVNLNNGVATSALQILADAIGLGVPWDSDSWGLLPAQHSGSDVAKNNYGKMLAGPIPIFDGGASYCESGGGSWNETMPLVGWVWGAIYDVRWQGAAKNKNIWLRIDPVSYRDLGDWSGGTNYGLVYTAPALLVQ